MGTSTCSSSIPLRVKFLDLFQTPLPAPKNFKKDANTVLHNQHNCCVI